MLTAIENCNGGSAGDTGTGSLEDAIPEDKPHPNRPRFASAIGARRMVCYYECRPRKNNRRPMPQPPPMIANFDEYRDQLSDLYTRCRFNELACDELMAESLRIERL